MSDFEEHKAFNFTFIITLVDKHGLSFLESYESEVWDEDIFEALKSATASAVDYVGERYGEDCKLLSVTANCIG